MSNRPGTRGQRQSQGPPVQAARPLVRECLQFFLRNPFTYDTAQGLARRMGCEPAAVAGALAELVDCAQLQVFGRGERAVYALSGAAGRSAAGMPAPAELRPQGSSQRTTEGWRPLARRHEPFPAAGSKGFDSVDWPTEGLTDREQEVLALTVTGLSNRAIAQALHISEHTVKNHLSRVFQKLGVSNRRELLTQWLWPRS